MRSDKHAQDIWAETHDSAVGTYGEGRRAHMAAYASLNHSYEKKGDRWAKKDHKGPSDSQAARGPTTKKKSTDPDRPTAHGRVARNASEAREQAKEDKREYDRARRRREKRAS